MEIFSSRSKLYAFLLFLFGVFYLGQSSLQFKLYGRNFPSSVFLNDNGIAKDTPDVYAEIYIPTGIPFFPYTKIGNTETKDSERNPDWASVLSVDKGRTLRIVVMDDDAGAGNDDDKIGEASIDIAELHMLGLNERSVDLNLHSGKNNPGHVFIRRVC